MLKLAGLLNFLQVMAPPAKKKKLSPSAATSASSRGINKFRSPFHENHFRELISGKNIVSERAIVLEGDQFVEIQEMIARRGWNKLVSFPKPASTLLVKEFFANACEEDEEEEGDDQNEEQKFTSYVRGKQVVYDPKTLNELFDLEDFPHCDFAAREKPGANIDFDDILRTLCISGAAWKEGKTSKLKKLNTIDLTPEAKCWSAFVLRTLLPCSNVSELNLKRANLLVSILKGENINVGRLLAHNLHETAKNENSTSYLNHPALISLLCEGVRVIAKKTEPIIKPVCPITSVWIRKNSVEAPLIPPPLPAPQRVSHDAIPPPEDHQEPLQERSLEERVHRMEIALESILVNQNKIMAMLQILMESQNQSQQPQGGEGELRAGTEISGDPFPA